MINAESTSANYGMQQKVVVRPSSSSLKASGSDSSEESGMLFLCRGHNVCLYNTTQMTLMKLVGSSCEKRELSESGSGSVRYKQVEVTAQKN